MEHLVKVQWKMGKWRHCCCLVALMYLEVHGWLLSRYIYPGPPMIPMLTVWLTSPYPERRVPYLSSDPITFYFLRNSLTPLPIIIIIFTFCLSREFIRYFHSLLITNVFISFQVFPSNTAYYSTVPLMFSSVFLILWGFQSRAYFFIVYLIFLLCVHPSKFLILILI